jgi:crotonobetainyl-CoA:carnitine CoA-transferase CaiB-like acyl-CoA transferase
VTVTEAQLFRRLTVLSLEQATTLPYLTFRLAQDGMRVIRLEDPQRGDPNRYVGSLALDEEGMRTYFLPNNLGKEAVTLNLGSEEGQALLHELVAKLPVDVFASNLKPSSYAKLGVDCDTLRALRPELIWLGITGFGPESNEPAYDPILQARSGFMELTGERDGTPTVFGLPMVDLGASEHAYGQVMKALYRRAETGEGCRIDVSMLQSAVSFMANPLMLSMSFGERVTRRGNTHQFFAPVSVYPTSDGHVYLAVGNDRQWEALVALPGFGGLADEAYGRNAGRIADVEGLNERLGAVLAKLATEKVLELMGQARIPAGRVNSLEEVVADPHVRDRLLRTTDPVTGTEVKAAPPPVETEHLRESGRALPFPPRLGEHNEKVYGEIGYDAARVADLKDRGVI